MTPNTAPYLGLSTGRMNRLRRMLLALIALCLAASVASAANVVFLVRVGADSEGNPLFRPVDSRDTYVSGLYALAQNSRAIGEAARYYDQVQRDKLAASLQGRGLSQ